MADKQLVNWSLKSSVTNLSYILCTVYKVAVCTEHTVYWLHSRKMCIYMFYITVFLINKTLMTWPFISSIVNELGTIEQGIFVSWFINFFYCFFQTAKSIFAQNEIENAKQDDNWTPLIHSLAILKEQVVYSTVHYVRCLVSGYFLPNTLYLSRQVPVATPLLTNQNPLKQTLDSIRDWQRKLWHFKKLIECHRLYNPPSISGPCSPELL